MSRGPPHLQHVVGAVLGQHHLLHLHGLQGALGLGWGDGSAGPAWVSERSPSVDM